jgi:hypothetical protein
VTALIIICVGIASIELARQFIQGALNADD